MSQQMSSALSTGDQTPVVLYGVNEDLHIITLDGQAVVSSRYVSEVFNKEHKHVLDSIREIIKGVDENSADLFIESNYQHPQNKQWYPEYMITRDGFTLLAMGFTGKEALQWKLKYIEAFNRMESYIREKQKPMCIEDILIAQLQDMKAVKEQLTQVSNTAIEAKQEVQAIRDTIVLDPAAWRVETTNLINKIAQKLGGNENIQTVRKESYELLDSRAKAKLNIRQTNMRRKVLEETGSTSKANKISKLDVIASEARLREIYIAIVKEMTIKYGVA